MKNTIFCLMDDFIMKNTICSLMTDFILSKQYMNKHYYNDRVPQFATDILKQLQTVPDADVRYCYQFDNKIHVTIGERSLTSASFYITIRDEQECGMYQELCFLPDFDQASAMPLPIVNGFVYDFTCIDCFVSNCYDEIRDILYQYTNTAMLWYATYRLWFLKDNIKLTGKFNDCAFAKSMAKENDCPDIIITVFL